MNILSQRWKGLRAIPSVEIVEPPTAVELLGTLSARVGADLWIKRDDRTSPRYGGNKVRKLEYLLGEALAHRHDSVITSGAAGSHHALATAIFARELGLEVHAVLMPQRYSTHVAEQLRALLATGAEIHPVRGGATLLPTVGALSARMRMKGRRPYVIPPGGSSVAGVIGQVEAGMELARQMEAKVLPEPDEIVVALGTGGTAAGLAVGLAAAGVTARVVGVRVVPRSLANRTVLGSLVTRVVRHLRKLDDRFPDVATDARARLEIDHHEVGDGYGIPTSAGRNAQRLSREHAGIELDVTYTAKAFAAALRRAQGDVRRILFVHTLSSADIAPLVAEAPPLPDSLRRLMKHV